LTAIDVEITTISIFLLPLDTGVSLFVTYFSSTFAVIADEKTVSALCLFYYKTVIVVDFTPDIIPDSVTASLSI
jgi:hypothetical protein